ncbi:Methyl-CpG-binding domain-containing protein 13 [Sesamum alatum]|uniref:Methyl-CpG-binding domain-containing protein 13 n=1 Tax=Sesamum alatum TaxID=300844 RepID=A0AAE1YUG8_9LAMI|nr:Methyl-CpG-binding domain-containing protein 13 [Sesamum alatum]
MDSEHPDWLPLDWKVCVKVRSFGRKDKYYINPVNGLKFNSKLEVLRYIKNAGKDLKLKQLNEIGIKKTVAEKLPPGWIKEIRTKRKGGKTRRDPYYIDPVSGRHFRSMQEVFRFLESTDSGKDKLKVDYQDHTRQELGDNSKSSIAGAKGQRWINKKADKIANVVCSKGASLGNADVPEAKYVEQRAREDDSMAKDLLDKLPQENGTKKHESTPSRNKRVADSKLRSNVIEDHSLQSDSQGAAVKNINTEAEARQNGNMSQQTKRRKSNSKWANDLPRRSSKRLARAEADPSLERKTSNQATEPATLPSEAETITSGSFCNSYESNKHRMKDRTETPTNNKQKESADSPLGDHASVLEEREDVAIDFKEDGKHERNLDSSLNYLLMDPCIEFAVKTLTGAIPIEDVNKVDDSPTSGSSSALPSVDIWADPCFEFAVKTLTGEIPFENSSHFQISLQQPQSSSGASGCNSLDNSYSSSYSCSRFDVIMKQQQGVRESSLSHPLNGSSQNFVDMNLHRGIEGRTGRCL